MRKFPINLILRAFTMGENVNTMITRRSICSTHQLILDLLTLHLFFAIYAPIACAYMPPHKNASLNDRSAVTCSARAYYICIHPVGTLIQGDSMSYGKNLTSENGTFQLGFFVRQSYTYLGIWYNGNPEVIVWVANRDKPIPRQHNCSLQIATDGIARVLDSNNQIYWSTNSPTVPLHVSNYTKLELLDNGNLILKYRTRTLWQSFNQPTDTFLPGMDFRKIDLNLTSWKSPENPAPGNYTLQIWSSGQDSLTLSIVQNWNSPYWVNSSSVPDKLTSLLLNNVPANSSRHRLVMTASGSIQLWELQTGGTSSKIWMAPKDQCDFYEPCGSSGVCDPFNSFNCKCLPGYKPNDEKKWALKDFSGGCSKKTSNPCGTVFMSLPMTKVPPPSERETTADDEATCKDKCQSECRCTAYSYDSNHSNCLIWTNELNQIQEEYYDANHRTLSIKVAHPDIALGSRTCNFCGTNVIPYPLSTGGHCGDPTYFSFQCNTSNGQVYYKAPNGNLYKVSLINPDQGKFVVQLPLNSTLDNYNASTIQYKVLKLNNSLTFTVKNWTVFQLLDRRVVEIEMSWKPPPPPQCNSSANCTDWPDTTCASDKDGKMLCLCGKGFYWNSLLTNCTQVHHKHMPLRLKVGTAAASGTVLLLLAIILFILHLRRKKATQRAGNINIEFKTDDIEDIDIPFVDYQSILAATDNFSDANKLGAGGFGPVYKGKLANGNEVAIKRLSAASTQGIEEFRNEVVLIAKLQHRNLVRVLGYCVKADEKILMYEYMPNKSLDSFLFDHTISSLLDWKKRFNILLGVARGILYLHQDSRLRIIHRDLKPSNILLDEDLNPKISDFGLARIVAGNEMATSTARVIGTYGYMSPEYALDGYFSIKSDVYSFGIVLLEVVSGKRCMSLLRVDNNLISLLGYAWTLWDQGNALELVDKSVMDSYDSSEVKRCINVGLLCVQEDPSDRPTMSTVVLMLSGDNMNLPYPKQPVFVARRPPSVTPSSSSKFGTSSDAELTTTVQGR